MIFLSRLVVTLLLIGGAAFLVIKTRAVDRLDMQLVQAILAAQPPLLLAQGLLALRFQRAVSRPEARFSICLAGSLLGQAADLVLPWRLSEFVRVIYLLERVGVPVSSGLAAAVIERSIDLVIIAVLILIAISLALVDHPDWRFAPLAAGAVALLLVLPLLASPAAGLIARLPLGRPGQFARRLLAELAGRVRDRVFWRALVPSVFAWLCALVATWLLLEITDLGTADSVAPASPGLVLAVFISTTIGAAAAILPAGVGTYEAGAVVALQAYGVPFDRALAIAVSLHLAQILMSALGGVMVSAASPLRFRDLLSRARAGAQADPSFPERAVE